MACAPMRSNVNLSTILRTAGCCAVDRMIVCGAARIARTIARDGAASVRVEVRNSLPADYPFPRRTALVSGNERAGLSPDELAELDDCVEIPVWGLPYSYNVATATAMALYEYCRQHRT